MPADDGQVSLVHGDYRLDNMIFAKDAPSVIAVLDWELSTLGHPLPISPTSACSGGCRMPPAFAASAASTAQRSACRRKRTMSQRYCERRGIAGIGNWTFYLAFSFFRLAAICQGVYKRALDGNASNPEKAQLYGDAVKLLAGLAVELIDEEG